MASRPKQADPRPAPRLYLVTPVIADAQAFSGSLAAALGAGDIAAVLLRLAEADERAQINCAKALCPLVQDKGAALLIDGHTDLVARAGADGTHSTGITLFNEAIEHLKPDRIVGVGGLITRHDAMLAAEGGADYVMFGEPDAAGERPSWRRSKSGSPGGRRCSKRLASLMPLRSTKWRRWRKPAPILSRSATGLWQDPQAIAAAIMRAAGELRLPESAA